MGRIESWLSSLKINPECPIYYLIILFLPTQLGRHFWPSFSYIYGIRVDYLSPTLYLTDVLIILLFVFWFKKNAKDFFPMGFVIFIWDKIFQKKILLLFSLSLILGIISSKNQMAGWYGLLKLIEFFFFGYYTSVFINRERFKKTLIFFSITTAAESLIALFQFINQKSLGGIFYFLGERLFNGQTPGIANASLNGNLVLRPYATFSHPNVLAGFLLIAMILLIYNLNIKKNLEIKIFIAVLLTGTISLFLSMNRIAIVLWLIIITIFLFKAFKQRAKKIFFYFVIFTILIFMIIFTPLGYRFFNLNLQDNAVVDRLTMVKNALSLIAQNPLFGVGINNSIENFQRIFTRDNIFYFQPVHNVILFIASEAGLVGLLFFLWFIVKTYQNLQFSLSDLRFTILTSILIMGLFDHYFLTLQQGQLLFSFILGLAWAKNYSL